MKKAIRLTAILALLLLAPVAQAWPVPAQSTSGLPATPSTLPQGLEPSSGEPLLRKAGNAPPPRSIWTLDTVDNGKLFWHNGDRSLALDASGHPHIAYGDDHLYYAWHDGTAWHVETVETARRTGGEASLALDTTGRPHISYISAGSLKHAAYDGSAWTITTVDGSASALYATSLDLDSANRPHIVYFDPSAEAVRYAHYDGTAWITESVDSGLGDPIYEGRFSLVLDASDRPHIAYYDLNLETTQYAYYDGAAWQIQAVDSAGGNDLSIALDSAGRPHISYFQSWSDQLKYAYFDGTSWQIQVVDSEGQVGWNSSLALDSDDHPHISYQLAGYYWGAVKYAYHDGTAWHVEVVEGGESLGWHTSVALDAAQRPHISYIDWGQDRIRYARYDGTTWQIETVETGGTAGLFASLALDPAGRPGISYCEAVHYTDICQRLKYAHYDGSTWQLETVAAAEGAGFYTSLALDPDGQAHISYCQFDTGTWECEELRYAHHDGTDWITETVDLGGAYTSLALDATGRPHIGYAAGNSIRHAYLSDTLWITETVSSSNWSANDLSLVLDPADHAHMVFYSGQTEGLLYAHHDGSSWQMEPVESGYASHPSLALDGAGRPHIGYYGAPPDYPLKYAYHDGTAWQIEVVESGAGGWQGDISLRLDSSGQPRISYYDFSTNQLKYAWFDGFSWYNEVVDSQSGGTGSYNSLALDANQLPLIGYYGQSDGDLKYAYPGPCLPVQVVTAGGPTSLPAGVDGIYTATFSPPTATVPILSWDNGAIGASAAYSWTVPGNHTLTVTATNPCSHVEDTLSVTIFCEPLAGVEISGPPAIAVGHAGVYVANAVPITASRPITYNWDNGALGYSAVYSWTTAGSHVLNVSGANLCGAAGDSYTVTVLPTPCGPIQEIDFSWQPPTPTWGQPVVLTATAEAGPTGWFTETVDRPGQVGQDTSLVVDYAGRPHISYYDSTAGSLKYAYFDGSAWQIQSVDEAGDVGHHTSLALDSAGRPHISYMDATHSDLRYAFFDGVSWQTETVDITGTVGLYTSLVLDAAGHPHITYVRSEYMTGQLRYAWHDGSTWHLETASLLWPIFDTALQLDSVGRPFLCFSSPYGVQCAHHKGTTWQFETIDAGLEVSLIVDQMDRPHLSYCGNYNNGQCTTLNYAFFDGTTWRIEAVDSITNTSFEGYRTRLQVDMAGRPHIAYYDAASGEMRYAFADGDSWFIETVESTSAAGLYLSLGLDPFGQPRLSYYAPAEGDLRYAYRVQPPTPPISYTWDLGDGTPAEGAVVNHSYFLSGSVAVLLEATNCQGAAAITATHALTVQCSAIANLGFTWTPPNAPAGQAITLTASASSTLPITFSWSFGDGGTGTGNPVTHIYTRTGAYQVVLTATNACRWVAAEKTLPIGANWNIYLPLLRK